MSADAAHPPHRHLTPDTIRFCPLCGAGVARQPVGPEKHPEMVCAGCGFIYYMNQKVVAGTIPWQDGRLLLTRRAIHPAHGKWTFPGGYVDWGETVDAGALRETWEETGLTVELGGLVGVYSYASAPVVIVVYEAMVTGGSLTVCHENDRLEWVTPAEIPWDELAFPSTVAAVRDFLARRPARD
ncbi:MAG TPA: NUDIX hydrolase [Candidatus Limnocylindria bacterium]|nr:NUDIX hydrolase [Candidatus Limnocylindria bacterium]